MAKKKIFTNCNNCGRSLASDKGKGKGGFVYRSGIGPNLNHQISCPCGIMTKLCQTLDRLQAIWNSKPNKIVEPEKFEVTFPDTRGMDPGTENYKQEKIDNSISSDIQDLAEEPF